MEAGPTIGTGRAARLRLGLTATVGYGSLAGLVAMCALLSLAAAASPGFLVPANRSRLPDWIAGVFAHSGVSLTGRGFVFLLMTLCVGYAVALVCRPALDPRPVVITIGVLIAILTLAPPLLSGDLFSYIAYARMGVVHGVNPYAHGPVAISPDPVLPFTHWLGTRSVYGPVFTLTSYALAPLGLTVSLWGLKALTGLAAGGLVALVWAVARRLDHDPLLAAMVVGLNPLFLVYGVGGGHNDVWMLCLAMAGVLAVLVHREPAGAAALAASVAVKASTAIIAPFMLIGARRRGALVAAAVVSALVLAAVAFGVFGSHGLGFLVQLERHQNLTSSSSWPVTLSGYFGGIAHVRTLGRIVFVVVTIGLLLASWRGLIGWISAAGWTLLALAVTSPWLLAWYLFWPLPFAAVARDRRLLAATLFAQLLFLSHRLPQLAG